MIRTSLQALFLNLMLASLAAILLTGCTTTRNPDSMVPLEDLVKIKTGHTSIDTIVKTYGDPKAILKPGIVASLPAERIAVTGRMTPQIYDSSRPYYEFQSSQKYYRIDSDTFFELFKQNNRITDQHRIYYYSDSIQRRGLFEPESRLWILVNSSNSVIEDYIYRKHYNARLDDYIFPVKELSSRSDQGAGPVLNNPVETESIDLVSPVHWYIGAGGLSGELASAEPAFDNISASGVTATGGIELAWHSSLEATMGTFSFETSTPSVGVYYPPDEASFGFFGFAYRFSFLNLDEKGWTPWLALEMAIYDVGLSNYVYTQMGGCTSIVYGIDIRVVEWFVIRAAHRQCSVDTEEAYFGDVSSELDSDIQTLHGVFRFGL